MDQPSTKSLSELRARAWMIEELTRFYAEADFTNPEAVDLMFQKIYDHFRNIFHKDTGYRVAQILENLDRSESRRQRPFDEFTQNDDDEDGKAA